MAELNQTKKHEGVRCRDGKQMDKCWILWTEQSGQGSLSDKVTPKPRFD